VKLRRTWPQRLLIAFNCGLVVLCLGSAWALAFSQRQIEAIPRVPLQRVLDRQDDPSKPVNFLLVGADSLGDGPGAPGDESRAGTFHADSISILRVDPNQKQAALLSLPRDLWVAIPGHSGVYKINEALTYANPPGSPGLLIETIRARFDIPVNYFVRVDFAAFRSMVDQLDGVNLWFDRPARDVKSGLFVDDAGCRLADGGEALAFARARAYTERQDDGTWKEDPTNDIGRIARQQYFMKQAAKKAIARGARNPIEAANLLGIAQRYVVIDDTLSPQKLLDLVGHFNAFNPEDLVVTQPFTERLVRSGAGGDGQRLLEAESQPVFDRFRERAPVAAPDAPAPTTSSAPTTAPGRAVPPVGPLASTTTTLAAPDASSFVPHPPPDAAC
jgi:LCP family protein required for cell wall assembly